MLLHFWCNQLYLNNTISIIDVLDIILAKDSRIWSTCCKYWQVQFSTVFWGIFKVTTTPPPQKKEVLVKKGHKTFPGKWHGKSRHVLILERTGYRQQVLSLWTNYRISYTACSKLKSEGKLLIWTMFLNYMEVNEWYQVMQHRLC